MPWNWVCANDSEEFVWPWYLRCLVAEDVTYGWWWMIFELNWDDLGCDPSLFTVILAGCSSPACVGLGGCCSARGSQQEVCIWGAGEPYLPHSLGGTSFGPLLVSEKRVKNWGSLMSPCNVVHPAIYDDLGLNLDESLEQDYLAQCGSYRHSLIRKERRTTAMLTPAWLVALLHLHLHLYVLPKRPSPAFDGPKDYCLKPWTDVDLHQNPPTESP